MTINLQVPFTLKRFVLEVSTSDVFVSVPGVVEVHWSKALGVHWGKA